MNTENEKLKYINSTCNTNYKSMDEVVWGHHSMFTKLPENFIREFSDKVDWYNISEFQNLSEDFIREFQNNVDWYRISRHQNLSENFIREFKNKVNWYNISESQKLSENFIREFKNKVDWCLISMDQVLTEPFIREYQNKVDWDEISYHQKLSEDFIREFADKVDWWSISSKQKLSEEYIREFADDVNWWSISKSQYLSENFIKEFKDRLYINKIEDNWIYKDKEFLKQQVVNSGLYECYDDYFIAYKGIRSDRYSNYNFQYQYMPGETYESWCDCSSVENSFGLSVWTEKEAHKYCDELVVKVKIKYEDVGRVVHECGKIRCKKITILD